MADLSPEDTLSITQKSYNELFKEKDFGLQLSLKVRDSLGFNHPLVRRTEGSSLVFQMGEDHFLKLTPPFFGDSVQAEIMASDILDGRVSFSVPKILHHGAMEKWQYIVSKTVPGVQAKEVFRQMSPENRLQFADDIGSIIKGLQNANVNSFKRSFGDWNSYLSHRLKNQKEIHLEKGNSPEWTEKICKFVKSYSKTLLDLSPGFIHADLNHENLMLEKINEEWRVSGVIDFGDSMEAPVELEFVLPILCFFKGKSDHQKEMLMHANYQPRFELKEYSNIMMALALQNRFLAFHDWFDNEISAGANSVEEIAAAIFVGI